MQRFNDDIYIVVLSFKKNIRRTFEKYLIMVGIRSLEYNYTDEQIINNIDYFRKCYNEDLSAYKALLFLTDYLTENKI